MYVQYKHVHQRSADVTDNQIAEHHMLLERVAKERDKEAFEQLFCHFAPRIKALMMKQMADADAAEDFMQETMFTVWTKADQFSRYRGSVAAWIFTIARNKRIDNFRKQGSKHYSDIDDYELTDESPGSEEMLLSAERDKLVAQASEALPEEQREIIKMSYGRELTQSEIAERLSIPLGTVKSRMRLAYKKIKVAVEDVS